MITSAHSNSSNSSGFNSFLQRHYEMICEIIFSKTVSWIFLIFCRSSFIDNFMMKNNFLEPKNQRKLNILRPIFLKKFSAHRFVDLICINKLEEFFFQKIFVSRTWNFFYDCKTTNLGIIFFHKKLIFYFFQGWLFNFDVILKTCFKNLFWKTVWKNGDFTILNKPPKPYKLP